MASVKDILEGKPLRCPLHPALVHLPIALFPLSVLLDLASWIWAEPRLELTRAAYICLAAGIGTGLIAGVTGLVDYTEIRDDHPAKKAATLHMILNLVALAVFGLGFGLRWGEWEIDRTPGMPLVVSVVGLALISFSGYLGGHLVYNDGVGVGRHRHEPRLPQTTIALGGAPGTFVPVGDETTLPESGTLRVQVNEIVLTIARADGGLYAFQEFCPHRYGPLSEGRIENCRVICPWHRSAFDVRTGKVTHGPAKIDLRTFRVEARDGKIWLEVPPADDSRKGG